MIIWKPDFSLQDFDDRTLTLNHGTQTPIICVTKQATRRLRCMQFVYRWRLFIVSMSLGLPVLVNRSLRPLVSLSLSLRLPVLVNTSLGLPVSVSMSLRPPVLVNMSLGLPVSVSMSLGPPALVNMSLGPHVLLSLRVCRSDHLY